MKTRTKLFIAILEIILIAAAIYAVVVFLDNIRFEQEYAKKWNMVEYKIANANITWSGAGYDGVWGNN